MPVLAAPHRTFASSGAAASAGTGSSVAPARPARRPVRALALVLVAALALVGFDRVRDLLPSFSNPFATETVDRTGPAVLKALEDVHRYEAATGSFQVHVDVEEDTRYVPAAIKGERTLFLATGTVDAGVDFSGIGDGAVTVAPDGKSVSVTLPRPALSEPRIDPRQSRVIDRDRGVLDRIGSVFSDSPTGERELYLLSEAKLAAAAAEAGLVERAAANTRIMLETLLAPLGVEDVEVRWVDGPSAAL